MKEASNSENATKILEVWEKLEKLCQKRFESLQQLDHDCNSHHEEFSGKINNALNNLTSNIADLELVDRPSIMSFAQVIPPKNFLQLLTV